MNVVSIHQWGLRPQPPGPLDSPVCKCPSPENIDRIFQWLVLILIVMKINQAVADDLAIEFDNALC